MKPALEDLLKNGIVSDLFKTERAVFIHKRIGSFAIPINESNSYIKPLLVYIQNLTFNESVLALSRLYDNPSRNRNRCILSVLKILKDKQKNAPDIIESIQTIEHLRHFNLPDILISDVEKNDSSSFAKHFSWHMDIEYQKEAFQDNINELRKVRDKVIAHNEPHDDVYTIKWQTFDDLLEYAKKLVGIIGWAFFSTAYIIKDRYLLTEDANILSRSIENLLDDYDIINNLE